MSITGGFLFDQRAFWGDENVLTMAGGEVAAYLRMLSLQWENGSLPADPARLAALVTIGRLEVDQATLEGWLQGSLGACFEEEGGRLRNPRLAEEREVWKAKRDRFRKAGQKGGKARAANARAAPEKSSKAQATLKPGSSEAQALSPSLSPSVSVPFSPRKAPQGAARAPVDKMIDCGAKIHRPDRERAADSCANGEDEVCLFCCIWFLWSVVLGRDAEKKKARAELVKARQKATVREIFDGVKRYVIAADGTPPDKVPHLFRWLQNERWIEHPKSARRFP